MNQKNKEERNNTYLKNPCNHKIQKYLIIPNTTCYIGYARIQIPV